MAALFCLLSLLEILVILERMEGRFLLLKLEDPTMEVHATDSGKSDPFLPKTIGSFYSNNIIISYYKYLFTVHYAHITTLHINLDSGRVLSPFC